MERIGGVLLSLKGLLLSSNARQTFVQQSSEYIQFDQPDVVTEAIREVLTQSK